MKTIVLKHSSHNASTRRVLSLVLFFFAVFSATAQQAPVYTTFTLDNGLHVTLCEEHSQPKIYGAVVVHAGSKDEKPTATGVAHYFEHIMFKGTDRIGTTDWKSEKVYLDSINEAYDRLHATQDKRQRQRIQKEINRLNIAASQYAIPNEVDAILQQMGCTDLNAGTGYDLTAYYNVLPANQLENWMDVYVERFRNPVFRLFQSELEAVYEEKNMYENQMLYDFTRNIFTETFGEHPYSRDVIGLAEHLKNPQPSEMQQFFNTYYVANNMSLVLVGDFDIRQARALVESKFGEWRSAPLPQRPTYSLPQFEKQKIVNVRQTPIKVGLMIFPGVPQNHPDHLPLTMLSSILGGGSGLLDKAVTEGRLMAAQLMPLSLQEAGGNVILYIPNLLGQKHEAAEQVIWDCLDSIRQGNFSDELLEAIRTTHLVEKKRQLEDFDGLSQLFLSLEMEGITYEQWEADNERWQYLTREDIIEVANRYFNRDHCTLVRSKMGFPGHAAAVKPDWEHLEAHNKDAHSAFAQRIAATQPDPIQPRPVNFGSDVVISDVTPTCQLYSTANPRNDIFNLTVTYRYGTLDNPDLGRAIEYLRAVGCDGRDRQRLNLEADLLGAGIQLSAGDVETTLRITGLEENLDSILSLVSHWLYNPTHDARQIGIITDAIKGSEKAARNDADTWFNALIDYADYGDSSSYLRCTPYKLWATRTPEQLHGEVLQILGRNGYATFSGNSDAGRVTELLRKHQLVREDSVATVGHRAYTRHQPRQSQVMYVSNRKFLQSDIALCVPGRYYEDIDDPLITLFNEYYGGGMNSVVFQEIREFRSLGYRTYVLYFHDIHRLNPGFLYGYLGTQCDKTLDGIAAMKSLFDTLPLRQDKLTPAIENLVSARNSEYIGFRDLPDFVYDCMQRGWTHDRRAEITEQIGQLTLEDLEGFHAKYIKGRPLLILISGNTRKFDKKALSAYGPVQELKFDQLFRF